MRISERENSVISEAYADYAPAGRLPLQPEELARMKSDPGYSRAPKASSGWILPDGSFLDFQNPYRDHSVILKYFSADRIEALNSMYGSKASSSDVKQEALAAGMIRVQVAPVGVSVTVWEKPTLDQLDALDEFIEDCEFSFDSGDSAACSTYVRDRYTEYRGVDDFARRALGDIRRQTA